MSRFLGQCPGNHDSNSAPKLAVNRHPPRHYWPQTPQLNRHTSQMKTGIPASRLYPRQLCDTPPRPAPGQPGEPLSSGRHLVDLTTAQTAQSSQKRITTGAAQDCCSLAGSPSSTSDCGGLSWLGNCAKCAIQPKTKSNGHDEESRRWADGSEQLNLSETGCPE